MYDTAQLSHGPENNVAGVLTVERAKVHGVMSLDSNSVFLIVG